MADTVMDAMETVIPRTIRTDTGIMARDASSTPGIGPTTGIMGGVLITGSIGNTGTVTGARGFRDRSN
jgi:hypothetical protein